MVARTAAQIAEAALRRIGVVSPYDRTINPQQFQIAVDSLDMILAEKNGSEEFWWQVPDEQSFDLDANRASYPLNDFLNTDLHIITRVVLVSPGGDRTPLKLVRKSEWDTFRDTTALGDPQYAYVTRNDAPTVSLQPYPTVEGFSLIVSGTTFSENIKTTNGQTPHGFPAAWDLWLIDELAAYVGAGPITELSPSKQDRLKLDAGTRFEKLQAYSNRENVRRVRFTQPRVL